MIDGHRRQTCCFTCVPKGLHVVRRDGVDRLVAKHERWCGTGQFKGVDSTEPIVVIPSDLPPVVVPVLMRELGSSSNRQSMSA